MSENEEQNQVIDIGKQDISKQLEKKKKVIKNTVAKDANREEFQMFMHLAKQYQLDPFQKEIFFWKKKGRTNIMTSRDGYLKIANRNPEYDGMDSGAIYPGDKVKKTNDGIKKELNVKNMNKKPVAAYACVYRKDRKQPIIITVPFHEYNKPNHSAWRNFPTAMITKVAESMALKRAFSVSGLVSKEEVEIDNKQNIEPIEDVTPEQGDNTNDGNNTSKSEDMSLEKAKNIEMENGKMSGKKLKDCPTGYLEWMAENWKGERLKDAAKLVYTWKQEQKEEENEEEKNRELTEKEKEIKDIIDGDDQLKKEMLNYMKEYEASTVDGLDDELYESLKDLLNNQKTDEEIAEEAVEDDEFDTPF